MAEGARAASENPVNLMEGAELTEPTEEQDVHEEPIQAKMKTEAGELKFRIDLIFLRSPIRWDS